MSAPNFLTVKEAIRLIQSGELLAQDLVQSCRLQIRRLNPRLNAFITVIEDTGQAQPSDASASADGQPSLPGIPVAAKDLYDTAGTRTTGGSLFFKDYIPAEDAVVIAKIRRAGARIIGKTNTHEIALGVTSVNPHFGSCRNPWQTDRIAGGSSGGSAVAVAAGMALAALGTDTGGSIRIPASLCGVVGLKPTYGRVSLRGVMPLSWNLDHAGPLTRSVEDAALLLQVMAGYDPEFAWSTPSAVEDFAAGIDGGIAGWRFALGSGPYVDAADPDVLDALGGTVDVLARLGAKVSAVDMSFLHEAALANGLMTQADGAAFHRERLREHPDWFGEDVLTRLETGRDLASAEYVLARRTQAETKRRLADLFSEFQILLLPSTPTTAPPIQGEDAVQQARHLTRFTAPFNLSGLPAISIPCGQDAEGLPIGCQMIAGEWREAGLLRAARAYERATDWTERRPSLT